MLLTSQRPRETETEPLQAADTIETLRQIIARQERREVSYNEAKDIGGSLLQFFQVLAEVTDEPEV